MADFTQLSDLDPGKSVAATDPNKYWLIYDSLFGFDPIQLTAQPGLAESWTWDSPTSLSVKLRTGVNFHDGTPFNAAAVKANLDRLLTDKDVKIASEIDGIAEVTAVDANSVRITLKAPNVAMPIVLSQRAGMMVSPKALEASKAGGAFQAVGTGPFVFSQLIGSDRLVATRNANYWVQGQPYLDKVTVVSVREPAQLVNGLRTGDFDMVIGVPVGQLAPLKSDAAITTLVESTLRYNRIYLNCAIAPLTDVRVRQALNYAIDRKTLMESEIGAGLSEVAWMPVPKAYWAFSAAAADRYPYDAAKAKQLLQEAGYAGQAITMGVSTGAVAERRAEVLKQFWGDVGLNVQFQVMEAIAAANKYYFENGFGMLSSAWGGRPDPDLSYRIMFSQRGASNPGKCGGENLDSLIDQGAQGQTQAARAAAYQSANEIIVSQALEVPLFFEPAVWAWRNQKVQNITWQLTNTAKFNATWVQ